MLFESTNLNSILFQISGYKWWRNFYVGGSTLATFGQHQLNEAFTYCRLHSNCKGITSGHCLGVDYYVTDGTPVLSNTGDCSWVMKLNS